MKIKEIGKITDKDIALTGELPPDGLADMEKARETCRKYRESKGLTLIDWLDILKKM